MTDNDPEIYRKGLHTHCYRMLGSLHEAEDAVQETMLRAWRASTQFEARTSMRTWLYRIATNVCLSALERRNRPARAMPQSLGSSSMGLPQSKPMPEQLWLEPYPDAMLEDIPDSAPSPQARYETREATQLAFIAAIQYLPPRQRASLLLRDVLGWSATETAETLDSSVASVNSALQRARETLKKNIPSDALSMSASISDDQQRLLVDRYVSAWEKFDLDGFVALLKEDAIFSMPPYPEWYQGRQAIRELIGWAWKETRYEAFRLKTLRANGQSAFALYGRSDKNMPWNAHAMHVLTLDTNGISVLTNFMDTTLFESFGLPLVCEEALF